MAEETIGADVQSHDDSVDHNYCDQCGTQLPADAKFCPGCGKTADAAAAPHRTRSSRGLVWVAVAVVLLLIAGVAVGGIVMSQNRAAEASAAEHRERIAELRRVYEAVAAIDSATTVGVNFGDYSAKVQDAQAALDTYTSPDEQAEEIVRELQSAMVFFRGAGSEWNDAIQSTYRSVDSGRLSDLWGQAGESITEARQKLEAYERK